jgi:hypothetical protein
MPAIPSPRSRQPATRNSIFFMDITMIDARRDPFLCQVFVKANF